VKKHIAALEAIHGRVVLAEKDTPFPVFSVLTVEVMRIMYPDLGRPKEQETTGEEKS
jgi:hypothetical protein